MNSKDEAEKMIGFLQGTLQDIDEDSILVNVGGVGYQVLLPSNAFAALPSLGTEIELYTHMEVRESNIALFGFPNKQELQLYKRLLTVSGIGPKGALNIIGAIEHKRFIYAILNEEINYLTKLPGVGKKTAQRLILELKDKLSLPVELYPEYKETSELASAALDALQGLENLGYQKQEILPFLTKGQEVVGPKASPQELIRFVLKEVAKSRRG